MEGWLSFPKKLAVVAPSPLTLTHILNSRLTLIIIILTRYTGNVTGCPWPQAKVFVLKKSFVCLASNTINWKYVYTHTQTQFARTKSEYIPKSNVSLHIFQSNLNDIILNE